MPGWQAQVYVRMVLARGGIEEIPKLQLCCFSGTSRAHSAASAPSLHLIPLLLPNLRGWRRASLPYAAGDATSTFAYPNLYCGVYWTRGVAL